MATTIDSNLTLLGPGENPSDGTFVVFVGDGEARRDFCVQVTDPKSLATEVGDVLANVIEAARSAHRVQVGGPDGVLAAAVWMVKVKKQPAELALAHLSAPAGKYADILAEFQRRNPVFGGLVFAQTVQPPVQMAPIPAPAPPPPTQQRPNLGRDTLAALPGSRPSLEPVEENAKKPETPPEDQMKKTTYESTPEGTRVITAKDEIKGSDEAG
jgi:hypothetical protein